MKNQTPCPSIPPAITRGIAASDFSHYLKLFFAVVLVTIDKFLARRVLIKDF
jgi:hypothetical protein